MIKALKNQAIIDLAMQEAGSAAYAMEIAAALGLSITADLGSGQFYDLPVIDNSAQEKSVSKVLQIEMNKPASNTIADETLPDGIGYMEIGTTFKIS